MDEWKSIVLRKILVTTLVFVLVTTAAVSAVGASWGVTRSSGGLVGYWDFNEGNGDTAYDRSGNGNDGTVYGATWVDNGGWGNALSFDGIDDYVSAPVNINPDVMPQMTMVAWVRPDDGSPTKQVISHDNSGFDRSLGIDPRGEGTGWSAFSGSGGVLGYHPVTIGERVFIAAVYDQNAETVKLFVDGALINEEKGSLGTGWEYIYIGANPSWGEHFSGVIDEVRIYNHALDQSQIQVVMKGGTPDITTPTPTGTPTISPTAEAVITVKSPKEGARYPAGEYVLVDWSVETPTDLKTVDSYVNGQRREFEDQYRKGGRVAFGQYRTGYPMNAEAKLGRNVFRVNIELADGRKYEKEVVFYIGEAEATPTPAPTLTKFKKCVGDEPYLYVEDRVMGKGKTIEIPIMMCNAKDLANMDLDWSYDTSVLKLIDVTKGSLNKKAFSDWHEVSPGKLKITFASSKGVSGSGSIAVMKFEVIGNTGTTSAITGTVDTASTTDGSTVSVGVNPGEFTVGTPSIKGDCDGDGEITVKDALVALRISVEKIPFDICYDYNDDGKVNSADARDMLKVTVSGGK